MGYFSARRFVIPELISIPRGVRSINQPADNMISSL